jgi:PKD repeat protein
MHNKRKIKVPTFLLLSSVFVFFSSFILLANFSNVGAQVQYQTHGVIAPTSINFHLIRSVQAGDPVLITINPVEGGSYFSLVLRPNMTEVDHRASTNLYDEAVPISGTHSYSFIADASGTFILKIGTTSSQFNYTISSSHPISTGSPLEATPFTSLGEINTTSTIYHTIQNVKVNDLLLISINPIESGSFFSAVLTPNLTQIGYRGSTDLFGSPVPLSGYQSYQFIADATGNYYLKLTTTSSQFNYTLRASHPILNGTIQEAVLPTPSPTPLPPFAQFSVSPKAPTVNQPAIFNAAESQSFAGNIASYYWNFGDDSNQTTTSSTIMHTYANKGNYSVNLTVTDDFGGQSVFSYVVLVSIPIGREPLSIPIALGTSIATTSATVAIGVAANKLSSNRLTEDLPRSQLQKFLNYLVGKEREDRNKSNAKERFFSSKKGQIASLAFSAAIMTIVFSYVEANGIPGFFDTSMLEIIVPSALLSSVTVRIFTVLSDTFSSQYCGVDKRYNLWPLGIITFVVTGLLVLFPFGTPGIIKTKTKLTVKDDALLTLSKTLILLSITAPFAVLSLLGYGLIADVGLLAVLTTVFFSIIPMEPLAGKVLARYKKTLAIIILVVTGILLYGFMLNLLSPWIYLTVGAISGVIGTFELIIRRKSLRNTTTALPPPPPPLPPPPPP